MDFRYVLQEMQSHGMKITKDRLLALIRKTNDKDFQCLSEVSTKYILVRVPVS